MLFWQSNPVLWRKSLSKRDLTDWKQQIEAIEGRRERLRKTIPNFLVRASIVSSGDRLRKKLGWRGKRGTRFDGCWEKKQLYYRAAEIKFRGLRISFFCVCPNEGKKRDGGVGKIWKGAEKRKRSSSFADSSIHDGKRRRRDQEIGERARPPQANSP